MKTPIIPLFYATILACGLSSCGEEEEKLTIRESELENEVEVKRRQLNELVRKVDDLETQDHAENLIDAELKLESFTRQIEFEKSEQVSLAEEKKEFESQLEDYRKKYPMGAQ